ncbi:MAG: transcription-repair coupling factor, partial [Desulfobulbales bacterium]
MEPLLSILATGHKRIDLIGLQGSSYAFVAARICAKSRRSLLFIAPSERQAELAAQDISLFSTLPVILYPGFDIPPYTPLSPDQSTVAERLSALYRLLTADEPVIFVASCESLLRRIMPKNILGSSAELVLRGEDIAMDGLVRRLVDLGYDNVSLVQAIGDFSA